MDQFMPANAREAFEAVTGVSDARNEQRMSRLLKEQDVKDMLLRLQTDELPQSETTLKMIHMHVETTARIIHDRIQRYNSLERVDENENESGCKKNE